MLTDLAIVVPVLFVLALAVSLVPGAAWLARGLLAIGTVCGVVLCGLQLTASGSGWVVPFGPDQDGTRFLLGTDAAWLLGFGFAAAFFVCIAGPAGAAPRGWCFGAAMSLLGAYGFGGLQDGMSFLVAYEVMSLGGAVMILADRRTKESGRPVLFMLAILEAGAVAILVAYLILTVQSGAPAFAGFQAAAEGLPDGIRVFIGLLLLAGFGAKIGIIPFYEWFPDAYGAASGATGALMSGIILNAAFFALGRGLLTWFHGSPGTMLALGIILVAIGVISAVLSALYAFQQDNWRRLLAFSSAENGSVAIALLGAAMIFAQNGSGLLAGLAWVAALIHLAAHTLAKGALFLTADGVTLAAGDDRLVQRGLLSIHTPWLGIGALIAVMSLAAMPPQAGFVSEWYLFETFFQSFHVASLAGRVALVLGGAGLALTAAIAFAVSIKVFGIGLQGSNTDQHLSIPRRYQTVVFVLGAMVLGLAVGMPVWLGQLAQAGFVVGAGAATAMRNGWLLVPLSATFSFISPSKLIIVMPLLAVLPISLLFLAMRRFPVRHPPVWYGGKQQDPLRSAVTQLTFSNAMRTFYGFVYRPRAKTERDFSGTGTENKYFIRRLNFSHDVAPIFGPYLFQPLERVVLALARTARRLQSGSLNLYLGIIGVILVIILATILF